VDEKAKENVPQRPPEQGGTEGVRPSADGQAEGAGSAEGLASSDPGRAQETVGQRDADGNELLRKSELPDEVPVLPTEDNIVFPGVVFPMHIQKKQRVQIVEQAVLGNKRFLALALKAEPAQKVGPDALYRVGTVCAILQMLRMPDGSLRLLAQGLSRSRVEHYTRTEPFLVARVKHLADEQSEDAESKALFQNLRNQSIKMVDSLPQLGDEVKLVISNIEEPGRLADVIASNLNLSKAEKQGLLETLNVKERMQHVTKLLAREMQFLEAAQRIQSQAESEISKGQREYYLRQQLKAIQEELGETDAQTAEVQELRKRLEAKNLPEEAKKEAERELKRLERMHPGSPEYSVARSYLDWVLEIPWNESTPDNLDLKQASQVLEEDHYGLEDVKERMLEFLAVRKLREDMKGSILCFVGPPGTGKTSIGKSIARAMGRKYIRISLGGVRDEAEIRGHRRTYIGSLPGRIISGLRKVGSNNPVFMLDEVDKLGVDFRGDPSSALLEVLDPEQNFSFTDHYLDVAFDLSRVLFIATANMLDTVPPALRDRLEVIEFPGYTEEEKLQIAKRYLVPQQAEEHGLKGRQLAISDGAISKIIRDYTREAGVRNLERQIATVCRKVAKKLAMEGKETQTIREKDLAELLGPQKFLQEVAERVTEPGVASGLAWTPSGGQIIFVEATRTPGDGKLILTGQLGDVMKESAQAAFTHVRAHHEAFGLDPEVFKDSDFHIHVPAGAIPKDGPSAGVTIAMALVSLCRNRRIRPSVAMSGEVTLRGKVLPVGGIKDKVLAARRAGIETVALPVQNQKDMADVPDYARDRLKFEFVDKVEDIMPIAFEDWKPRRPRTEQVAHQAGTP